MGKQKNYQILSMLVWFIVTFVKMVAFFPLLHDRVFWGKRCFEWPRYKKGRRNKSLGKKGRR